MQNIFYAVGAVLCLFVNSGCQSVNPARYPVATRSVVSTNKPLWHTVRIAGKTNVMVRTIDRINPLWWFGNVDDPLPPDWYRPGKSLRRTTWFVRNPMHNLMFYTVGIADKDSARSGYYPETIFNPNEGWNYTVCKRNRCRMPLVSYQCRSFHFYFGWRKQGNFGIKINFEKPKLIPKPNIDVPG